MTEAALDYPQNSMASRIERLGFPSAGQTVLLKRCLASYVSHASFHDRSVQIAVVVDTMQPRESKQSVKWLSQLSVKCKHSFWFADERRKRWYADRLVAQGFPPELILFALTKNSLPFRNSAGGNRNALLLHFANQKFLSCDDDSICRPVDFRQRSGIIKFLDSDTASLDMHFIATVRAALTSVDSKPCDLLAAHESLLGKSLDDISPLGKRLGSPMPENARLILQRDYFGRNCKVAVTMSGIIGDSGIPDTTGLLLARGVVRTRYLEAWEKHGASKINRATIRGICNPSIMNEPRIFTTTATGLDNSRLLPPFIPSGLGEDYLFGRLIYKFAPHLYAGHIPVGVPHVPQTEKYYEAPPSLPSLADLIGMLIAEGPDTTQTSNSRSLQTLGQYLIDLCNCSDVAFYGILSGLKQRHGKQLIGSCRAYLRMYEEKPDIWATELRMWIGKLEESAKDSDRVVRGFGVAERIEARVIQLKDFIRRFGALINTWPEIVEASQYLCLKGTSLAETVS